MENVKIASMVIFANATQDIQEFTVKQVSICSCLSNLALKYAVIYELYKDEYLKINIQLNHISFMIIKIIKKCR